MALVRCTTDITSAVVITTAVFAVGAFRIWLRRRCVGHSFLWLSLPCIAVVLVFVGTVWHNNLFLKTLKKKVPPYKSHMTVLRCACLPNFQHHRCDAVGGDSFV